MTFAPQTLVDLQARCSRELGTTNLGIVGDATHVATGGYHIGAKTLRANGMSGDYSLEFAPDHADTSDRSCAIDLGGTPGLLMTLGNRLVHALKNRDPRVYKRIRATNAPFDGVSEDRRYDCEDPSTPADDNCQVSSDRNHIHIEFYRTLITSQDVMDGLFDVLAGNGEMTMDTEVQAEFKAVNDKLDALRNLIVGNQKRLVEDLKLDRAQSAHDATETEQ